MEALVLILVEALVGPLLAVVTALGAFLGSCLVALVSLAFGGFRFRRTRETASSTTASPSSPVLRRFATRLLAGCALMVALAAVVADRCYFPELARYALQKQAERTGIHVTAGSIDGSFFSGRVEASDVVVRREGPPGHALDLRADRVTAQVHVWHVLANPRVVDRLELVHVRGSFTHGPRTPGARRANGQNATRRSFQIRELAVVDLAVDYRDAERAAAALPIAIRTLTVAPLRSRWAAFDLLFRGNGDGTVAGTPFAITTGGDDAGRTTKWRAHGLPIAVLAEQLGSPFDVFVAGTADVEVDDRWQRVDDAFAIDMDWSIRLHGARAELPRDVSPLLAKVLQPLVQGLQQVGDAPAVTFRVRIDENRCEGEADAATRYLRDTLALAATVALAKQLGVDTTAIEAAARGVGDEVLRWIDAARRRK